MGITNFLTGASVDDLVRTEEIPLRSASFPAESIDAVFRYGAPLGAIIHCHAHLVRGMDEARRQIDEWERRGESYPSGTVIVADTLSGGKGRFRREWHAPEGGVWFTLVIADTLLPESARLYPFAAGVACCETVRALGAARAHLKWVNDVLVDGRKLAGILIEQYTSPVHGEDFVLIGIGVNVNNLGFPEDLPAVSLRQLTGRSCDLPAVTGLLLAKLRWNIGLLHYEEARQLAANDGSEPSSAHPLMNAWRELSDTVGRRVRFGFDVQRHPDYQATVIAVEDDGGLVLRHDDPAIVTTEIAGEILYLDFPGDAKQRRVGCPPGLSTRHKRDSDVGSPCSSLHLGCRMPPCEVLRVHMVSVIIPTYNRVEYLPGAVASVLAQQGVAFELIIVDDGSTDATLSYLATLPQSVRCLRQANRGPASARNTGIRAARGEFLAFLDSDDRFAEGKLAKQLAAMVAEPSYPLSHTQELWYRRGEPLHQKRKHRKEQGDLFARSLELCVIGMSTVMARKSLFEEIGLFDESMPCCEDYDLWLRVCCRYPVLLVDAPLTVKNGGRSDQVSVIHRVGMDRFRIEAIARLLQTAALSCQQRRLAVAELERKTAIYVAGCRKHGHHREAERILRLLPW